MVAAAISRSLLITTQTVAAVAQRLGDSVLRKTPAMYLNTGHPVFGRIFRLLAPMRTDLMLHGGRSGSPGQSPNTPGRSTATTLEISGQGWGSLDPDTVFASRERSGSPGQSPKTPGRSTATTLEILGQGSSLLDPDISPSQVATGHRAPGTGHPGTGPRATGHRAPGRVRVYSTLL